jgi:hypothetical protein
VIDLGYRAADAPTLAPGSPHRYHARILGVMADATVLEDDARRERLAAATLTGLAPGPLPVATLAGWATAARDPARTERMIAQTRHLMVEGRRYRSTRRVLSPFLAMVVPLESARSLLIDWQLDEPDEPAMWRARAELELRAGNPSEVLHYADRLLAKQPGNAPALDLRRKALEEMERLAKSHSR